MKLDSSAMLSNINQYVTSMTAQIEELEVMADQLMATLAAATVPTPRPKTVPILFSFLFFLEAIVVLLPRH